MPENQILRKTIQLYSWRINKLSIYLFAIKIILLQIIMPQLVKKVRDKHLVEFDKGSFDNWCVFLTRSGEQRYAPKDLEYFTFLAQAGNRYGHQRLYDDFVCIYNHTDNVVNLHTLRLITALTNFYAESYEELDIWFSVIYAGMIAEENKQNAILKKRIKRLGMYQLLIQNHQPELAANFSKEKKWKDLDVLMKQYGF